MLIETLIGSLLIGLIYRRHMDWLQHLQFDWAAVALAAFFMEASLNLVCNWGPREVLQWICENTLYFQVVIYYLLFVFVIKNGRIKGMVIMGIGFALNALVIFANKGFMPVDITMGLEYQFDHTLYDLYHQHIFGHAILSNASSWAWLADVIDIPPPYKWPKTISLGDLFIDVGVCVMVLSACFKKNSDTNLQTQESNKSLQAKAV